MEGKQRGQWDDTLKNSRFSIEGKIVKSDDQPYQIKTQAACVLINTPLQKNIKWRLKILRLDHQNIGIGVGIGLLNPLRENDFKTQHKQQGGHGLYIMWPTAYTYSDHDMEMNLTFKGFSFRAGDVLGLNFNKDQGKLRFSKGEQKLELSIAEPTSGDQYYALVCSLGGNDTVELLDYQEY